jgi:hypothetical protein
MTESDEERQERRRRRLLGPSAEAQRDAEAARATVRPRSECPHCNPIQEDIMDDDEAKDLLGGQEWREVQQAAAEAEREAVETLEGFKRLAVPEMREVLAHWEEQSARVTEYLAGEDEHLAFDAQVLGEHGPVGEASLEMIQEASALLRQTLEVHQRMVVQARTILAEAEGG